MPAGPEAYEAHSSIPDLSVPPPGFMPTPVGPATGLVLPPVKTAEDLEYEQKVAAFLQRNEKDKPFSESEPKKKARRTFTDFPVPSSSSRGTT